MKRIKAWKVLTGLLVVLGIASSWMFFSATHSSTFTLSSVEVEGVGADSPLTISAVNQLTAVPVGKSNVFGLDLQAIESRILENTWIKSVQLEKRLPHTLAVKVKLRSPRAILQSENGSMSYVDEEGFSFAPIASGKMRDLPLLVGFEPGKQVLIKEALEFSDRWQRNPLGKAAQISAVQYDRDRGFRASLVYPIAGRAPARLILEFSSSNDLKNEGTWRVMGPRLQRVFRHISSQSFDAYQIFVSDGKKIVVKTSRGS